jgi:hypothetical protein
MYCTLYIHKTRDYRQYSSIDDVHNLQLILKYALGFSVFTNRILVTDLSQSHCKFKSNIKSSLHGLIPFLSFLLNHPRLPSPEFDPILILATSDPRYAASMRSDRKYRFLYCCEGVFRTPLHSNGSYSIAACVFVDAGICVPSRCLAMCIHVTIFFFCIPTDFVRTFGIEILFAVICTSPLPTYENKKMITFRTYY